MKPDRAYLQMIGFNRQTSKPNPGENNTSEETVYARAQRLTQEAEQRRKEKQKQEEKDRVQQECQVATQTLINELSEGRFPVVVSISYEARRCLEKKTPSFLRSQSPERIALLESLAPYGVPANAVCIEYMNMWGLVWVIRIKP